MGQAGSAEAGMATGESPGTPTSGDANVQEWRNAVLEEYVQREEVARLGSPDGNVTVT